MAQAASLHMPKLDTFLIRHYYGIITHPLTIQ